jgi:hypothetical protein
MGANVEKPVAPAPISAQLALNRYQLEYKAGHCARFPETPGRLEDAIR